MDPVFVELITAGIGLAKEILSFVFVPKAIPPTSVSNEQHKEQSKTIIHEHSTVVYERESIVIREPVLDKETLQKIINDTTEHFSKLFDEHTVQIINEMHRQRVKDAVQEVQARVSSLKMLLNTSVTDSQVAIHLVISALNPLQVSLEVAKFRLKDYGQENVWQYCYLLGTSALISGYTFLNQDVSHIVAELEDSMRTIQIQILNEAATIIIPSKGEFPWNDVSKLLLPEGADDLLSLYQSAINKKGHSVRKGKQSNLEEFGLNRKQSNLDVFDLYRKQSNLDVFDVNSMTVDEIRSTVPRIKDVKALEKMLRDERANKHRISAIDIIEKRLNKVSN